MRETGFYVESGGVPLYCRKIGTGLPLILLHGFGQSNQLFEKMERELSQNYQVILLDSRGHGLSGLGKGPLTTRIMAADVVAVLDALQIEKCFVLGYSDGANIGLQMAIDAPQRLLGVVSISANARPEGLKPLLLLGMKLWRGLAKLGCLLSIARSCRQVHMLQLLLEQPEITREQLQKLTIPVLLIWGQRDFMRREHVQELAESIPASRSLIFKGATHFSILKKWPYYKDQVQDFIDTIPRGDTFEAGKK